MEQEIDSTIRITITEAIPLIEHAMFINLPVYLSSSPGIGKSDITRQLANKHNLELIDHRLTHLDPLDFMGMPYTKTNERGEVAAGFAPVGIFPLDTTEIPKGKEGFLLFLDEFPSGTPSVQAAAYRLLLDREVGQHKLHPNTIIIGAGNLITDRAIVNRLGTATQSRLLHLEIRADIESWITWANDNHIDHRIRAYLNHRPENLHKFNPNHNDKTFSCPRTWYFLSKLIEDIDSKDLMNFLPLLAGTIGQGVAREFVTYTEIYKNVPTYTEIISSPETIYIKKEPAIQWALVYMVANFLEKTHFKEFILFLDRLDAEFKVLCLRAANKKYPKLIEHPDVLDWCTENASDLID
jgi:hypothetical protein